MPRSHPSSVSIAITEGLSLTEAAGAFDDDPGSAPGLTPEPLEPMSLADRIVTWDRQFIVQTYGRLPVVLVRGEGAVVWDSAGNRFLDLESGGRAGNALGHSHPKVVKALKEQADKILFLSNDFYNEHAANLASRLADTGPCKRVFFQNSGTEANECALKLARKWARREHGPNRYEFITAEQSFHGRTMGALKATGQPKYQDGYEPLPEGFRYVPYNDIDALADAISPQTAALMFEPILGESGCHPASTEYLQAARDLCDRHGLLLLLDEVQTGFGRTGTFWAYEQAGIAPDIVTIAKSLGGGLPMGACLAREHVATAFSPGDHGCTFGGNPACAATALAALEALAEENLIAEARRKGELFRSLLDGIQSRTSAFSDVRVRGLMIGLDLARPVAANVVQAALKAGLIVNASGPSTLRLLPALVITDEQLAEAAACLEPVLVQCLEAE